MASTKGTFWSSSERALVYVTRNSRTTHPFASAQAGAVPGSRRSRWFPARATWSTGRRQKLAAEAREAGGMSCGAGAPKGTPRRTRACPRAGQAVRKHGVEGARGERGLGPRALEVPQLVEHVRALGREPPPPVPVEQRRERLEPVQAVEAFREPALVREQRRERGEEAPLRSQRPPDSLARLVRGRAPGGGRRRARRPARVVSPAHRSCSPATSLHTDVGGSPNQSLGTAAPAALSIAEDARHRLQGQPASREAGVASFPTSPGAASGARRDPRRRRASLDPGSGAPLEEQGALRRRPPSSAASCRQQSPVFRASRWRPEALPLPTLPQTPRVAEPGLCSRRRVGSSGTSIYTGQVPSLVLPLET
jgi:hypothetical protein